MTLRTALWRNFVIYRNMGSAGSLECAGFFLYRPFDERYTEYLYPCTTTLKMNPDKFIEQEMYRRAVEFIPQRYPKGWGGVAIIHTLDARYFTTVAIQTPNPSPNLCIEVGAITEAHKYDVAVTHCLCVIREDENSPFKILSPCGLCQERLRFWGVDVKVAITTADNVLQFLSLKELQPYHWTQAYSQEETVHFGKKDTFS